MDNALKNINPKGDLPLHISFDIDGCTPSIAPGTGTKKRGGLTYREAHYIVEECSNTGNLVSMDMVEINIDKDVKGKETYFGDNKLITADLLTARLGMTLIESTLGSRII